MVIEKDGKVSYVENEPSPSDVTVGESFNILSHSTPSLADSFEQVSGAGTVLSRL